MSKGKYSQFFDTGHLQSDLKQRSISGGMITSMSQVINIVLTLGSVVVLARMLSPEHFGLIAMVTALTVMVERFQDFGLGDATIQREGITHEQVSTLFWINLCACIFFAILVSGFSKTIAWFYHDQRLVWITVAFSSNFIVSGIAIQHQALIRRQMRFGIFAWIQILSTIFGFAIAILLAWRGYGYWALVWKELARNLFRTSLYWLLCPWRPCLPVRHSGVKSMLKFGRNVTGSRIVFYISQSMDSILIGKFCGAITLGFYSRAQKLVTMPADQIQYPINYVSLPALSSLQNDPSRYKRYFEKMLGLLSFVYMPIVVYIGVFSKPIVSLVLGLKWMEVVPFFRLLAISVFALPLLLTFSPIMLSTGKARRFFFWGLFISISLTVSFLIGIRWGAIGVAAAYPVATWTNFIFSLFFVLKDSPVNILSVLKSIYRPVSASIIMGGILIFLSQFLSSFNTLMLLLTSTGIGVIIYCGVWMFFPGGFKILREFLSYPISVLRTKKLKESII